MQWDGEIATTNASPHDMYFKLDLKRKTSFYAIYKYIIYWDARYLYRMRFDKAIATR